MSIVRLNEFCAPEGKGAALGDFLAGVIAVIRDSPGCLDVELLADPSDPTRFAIVERWVDVAAHQAAAGRVPPEQMAQVRPLLAEPPRGRYYEPRKV